MIEDLLPSTRTFRVLSCLAAVVVALGGVVSLALGPLDADRLLALSPALTPMKPNTALAFVLAGIGLLALVASADASGQVVVPARGSIARRVAQGCGVAVAAIGILTTSQYLGGWDFGIDELLRSVPAAAGDVLHPGRPSPISAIDFVLFGLALSGADWKREGDRWPAEWAALVVASTSYAAVIGYAYGVEPLYRIAVYSSMALTTAVSFLALALGLLCARPHDGVFGIAVRRDAGGVLMRRLLPAAVFFPPLLGWLCLFGNWSEYYPVEYALALFAILNVVTFVTLVWWTGRSARGIDSRRRRAAEALARSNIELQRFAYVTSHDLQTPLRSIASFLQLLQEEYAGRLDERADDWIRRAVSSTGQLRTMILDAVEYSRVDVEGGRFEDVSMNEIVDAEIDALAPLAKSCGATIVREDLPNVRGDRAQISQLVQNVLDNALRYRREEPPRVDVSAAADDAHRIFAVRDNGVGIAPRHQERIFEVFYRLHGSRDVPGTGIGLAMCRRIVHRHGGRIWVESVPGRGSTFFFTLPRADRST